MIFRQFVNFVLSLSLLDAPGRLHLAGVCLASIAPPKAELFHGEAETSMMVTTPTLRYGAVAGRTPIYLHYVYVLLILQLI